MRTQDRNRYLVFFLSAMVCLHVFFIWNARSLIRKGYPDFTIFYSAATIVRQGLGPKLYDPALQYRVQQEFASGVTIRQGALPYNHPPFEALAFIPFTCLPYLPAFIAWDVFNVLLLLAVSWRLRSNIPGGILRGLFVALAFFPVCIALLQGQDILLLLALVTFAFASLKKKNDLAAGCWLGLGLFRFQIVLPLVVLLALGKRFKVVLGFATVAGGLFFISAGIMGWHGLFDYPRYVWHVEQTMGHGAIVPSDMPNLRGLLASALTDRMSKLGLQVLTVLLSLLLIFFTAAKWRSKSSPDSLDLIFSLCVVTTVVVSYHAFAYDLCLLLVPIVLVLGYLRRQRTTPSLIRIALLLPVALLFVGPLQMLLWLRYGQLCILTILLGAWAWGISRAISEDSEQRQIPVPADY